MKWVFLVSLMHLFLDFEGRAGISPLGSQFPQRHSLPGMVASIDVSACLRDGVCYSPIFLISPCNSLTFFWKYDWIYVPEAVSFNHVQNFISISLCNILVTFFFMSVFLVVIFSSLSLSSLSDLSVD